MRKMVIISNNCLECVFHKGKCVLGRKRPWNSMSCDDYRPYCLVCSYPKVFCNTCRNLGFKHLKPLEDDMKPMHHVMRPPNFDCVWQPPIHRQ